MPGDWLLADLHASGRSGTQRTAETTRLAADGFVVPALVGKKIVVVLEGMPRRYSATPGTRPLAAVCIVRS